MKHSCRRQEAYNKEVHNCTIERNTVSLVFDGSLKCSVKTCSTNCSLCWTTFAKVLNARKGSSFPKCSLDSCFVRQGAFVDHDTSPHEFNKVDDPL